MPVATRPVPAALLLIAALAVTGLALHLWWPLGVVLGVALGVVVTLGVAGAQRSDAARAEHLGLEALLPEPEQAPAPEPEQAPAPAAATPAADEDSGVRADLGRLKTDLGDEWPDFARAARLVVETQYASAARLQRELQVPYSRARRLLADLEAEHIVGPPTGSLPRQVLLPKERLPEVERLLADA